VLYIKDSCGTGVSLPYNTNNNNLIAGTEITSEELTALEIKTSLNVSIKAYPNPFTSEFVVSLPSNKEVLKSTIKITDLAGRIMLTQTTSASTITIGKALAKGMYLVQVWQGDKLVYHTTVMKQ